MYKYAVTLYSEHKGFIYANTTKKALEIAVRYYGLECDVERVDGHD